MMKRKLLVCLVPMMFIAMGCSQNRFTAEPGTPSHVVENHIKAIEEGDVDLYFSIMDAKMRAPYEQSKKMVGDDDKFYKTMRSQITRSNSIMKGARVNNETISGNEAKVTLALTNGQTLTLDLTKEPDGWKIFIK